MAPIHGGREMNKYEGREFCDPVVRCDSCNKITHRKFISKHGGCFHCGNKRFVSISAFSEEEFNDLKSGNMEIGIEKPYELDRDYFKTFGPTQEVKNG